MVVGPPIGVGIFVALAGTAAGVARAAWLAAGAAFEELLWRGVVLAILASWTGAATALVASTAGFALAHRSRHGRRAWIHLVTGSAFGGAFVCAGLWAAIAAHAVYNLLADAGIRTE
jgi:membrane protease YdiL (CAAX protease family)